MKGKIKFTLTDLLICYAWNRAISEQHLLKYLKDVCKIIRDNSECESTVTICRRFIKLISLRKGPEALAALKVGYEEFYLREGSNI